MMTDTEPRGKIVIYMAPHGRANQIRFNKRPDRDKMSGMDKDAVLDVMSRFKKAIEAQHIRVDRMILFGSQATGTAREGSDIDVLVISDDFRDKGYWQRIDILSAAIYDVFEPIEATALTPEEWNSGTSPVAEYVTDGAVEYAV